MAKKGDRQLGELLNSFFAFVFMQKEEKAQLIKSNAKGDRTGIQVKNPGIDNHVDL